ncbi:MAG: VanZ family protein [Burkholderiales bacterium]
MLREQPSTLARYLFVAYALLVVYASLHPFSGWRDQGLPPLAFLTAPFPRFISAFDVTANVIGYVPFGFLAVLAVHPSMRGGAALAFGIACAFLLSFLLEALQLYLPSRISSNLDLLANTAGGTIGALAAAASSRHMLRDEGLQALRYRFFLPGGRADLGLVLLGLWLLSQLNPETLLFGAGDLRGLLQTPPLGKLYPAGLFLRVEAAVAGANIVAAGLLVSCLTARGQPTRRLVAILVMTALAVRSLAFGLLLSPQNMLLWVTPGALYGVAAGTVLLLIAVELPRTAQLALTGLALMAATALVNLAPANPYMTASLALWRQGHFLNFNGVTRIVSAAWPFVAMIYLVLLAAERGRARG